MVEMTDDIETLRNFFGGCKREIGIGCAQELAALDRLQARVVELEKILARDLEDQRDSLRKALDDRFAADKKAARAIFAETGRTAGFPSVKEVVGYYIAEVERLEKELGGANLKRREAEDDIEKFEFDRQTFLDRAKAAEAERESLRAKLERAKSIVEAYVAKNPKWVDRERGEQDPMGAHALLAELSAV